MVLLHSDNGKVALAERLWRMGSKGTCFAVGEDSICLLPSIECAESLSLDIFEVLLLVVLLHCDNGKVALAERLWKMGSKGTCFAVGENSICLSPSIECVESLSLDFLVENGTKEKGSGGLEIGRLGKNEVRVCFG